MPAVRCSTVDLAAALPALLERWHSFADVGSEWRLSIHVKPGYTPGFEVRSVRAQPSGFESIPDEHSYSWTEPHHDVDDVSGYARTVMETIVEARRYAVLDYSRDWLSKHAAPAAPPMQTGVDHSAARRMFETEEERAAREAIELGASDDTES